MILMHAYFFQVEVLTSIAGEDARKINTTLKMVRKVVTLIIDRVFLSLFTWSGKSKPGTQKKNALQHYLEVVNIIYTTTSQKHKLYTKITYHQELVNSVLKFAYE